MVAADVSTCTDDQSRTHIHVFDNYNAPENYRLRWSVYNLIGDRILQECVRYGTGILGTGIDVVPNLPKCPVPVLMSYRIYRSVRYRY